VILVSTPYGKAFVHIIKGGLDKEHHGKWWWTEKEWKELMGEGTHARER
jgi:hypothetical protein